MNYLGVYFGPNQIYITEVKGKKILASCQILLSRIAAGNIDEKVPEDVKLIALLKDELRKNKISAQEAVIGIPGKDLIIRTFDLPKVLREEETTAINFEVRKYIPFRIEDLVSDYRMDFDKATRKNFILFAGIKKDTLDKYSSIFAQLDMRVHSIEYSAFGVLRLIKSFGFRESGIVGFVNIDLNAVDETNFMVLKSGFPLFSRDIFIAADSEMTPAKIEKPDFGAVLDKLKAELRVSLDFYHRKFVSKRIEKIFYLCPDEYRLDLEAFTKEMNYPCKFIDTRKYANKTAAFSLGMLKAYGSAMDKVAKSGVRINFLTAKEKLKYTKEGSIPSEKILAMYLADLRVKPMAVTAAVLMFVAVFAFGFYKKTPLKKDILAIINARLHIPAVKEDTSYEELLGIVARYKQKIQTLDGAINNQLFLTQILGNLPKLAPDGVYLRDFSFRVDDAKKINLTIRGFAYLADSEREMSAVNAFFVNLKNDPVVNANFTQKNIASIQQGTEDQFNVTDFEIACQK